MEKVRKHRDIEIFITEKRRNYLVSKPDHHITKVLTEYLLTIEMGKKNANSYELGKISMHEFWYDHVKPKYDEKANLCYMDTDSLIVYTKIGDIYKDIAEDVDRPLPKEENKKVTGLMKDELDGNIMTKFVVLKAKSYSYLIDDGSKDKKEKDRKTGVIKKQLKLQNYKNCLEVTQLDNKVHSPENNEISLDSLKKYHKEFIKNNKLILTTQQRFKSERHNECFY